MLVDLSRYAGQRVVLRADSAENLAFDWAG